MGALMDGLQAFGAVNNMFRQQKLDDMQAKQFDRQEKQQGVQDQINQQTVQINDLKIKSELDTQERTDFDAWAPAFMSKTPDQVSPEDIDRLLSYKFLGLNRDLMMRPDYDYHLEVPSRVLKGEQPLNSPQTLQSANIIWRDKITKGLGDSLADGSKVTDKRIAAMHYDPDADVFMFDLAVQDDKGQWHVKPMTDNRSSNEVDDPYVAQIPLEDVMKNVTGQKALMNLVNTSGYRDIVKATQSNLRYAGDPKGANAMQRLQLQYELGSERDQAKVAAQHRSNLAVEGLRHENRLNEDAADRGGQIAAKTVEAQDKDMMVDPLSPDYMSAEVANARGAVTAGNATPKQVKLFSNYQETQRQSKLRQIFGEKKAELSGVFSDTPSDADVIKAINEDLKAQGKLEQDFSFLTSKASGKGKGSNLGGGKPKADATPGAKPKTGAFSPDDVLNSIPLK